MVKIFIYGEVRVDIKSKGKKWLSIEDVCHDMKIHCNTDGLKNLTFYFST